MQIDAFISSAKPGLIELEDFQKIAQFQQWQREVSSFHFDMDTFRLFVLRAFNFNGFPPSYSSCAPGLGIDFLLPQRCGIIDSNVDVIG